MAQISAEKLVWFVNKKLTERKIAAVAVTLIDADGMVWDCYAINQQPGQGGLYQLIGAVDCLKDRLVRQGEPDVFDIARVLESAGLCRWDNGEGKLDD